MTKRNNDHMPTQAEIDAARRVREERARKKKNSARTLEGVSNEVWNKRRAATRTTKVAGHEHDKETGRG